MEVSEQRLHLGRAVGTVAQIDVPPRCDGCGYRWLVGALSNDRDELRRTQVANQLRRDDHGLVAYSPDPIVRLGYVLLSTDHQNSTGVSDATLHELGHVITRSQIPGIDHAIDSISPELFSEIEDPAFMFRAIVGIGDEDYWRSGVITHEIYPWRNGASRGVSPLLHPILSIEVSGQAPEGRKGSSSLGQFQITDRVYRVRRRQPVGFP
jgi:hypothetical protein